MEEMKATGTRKSRITLLSEAIASFNKREENRQYRIQTDEALAIKFMSARTEPFLRELKIIWGSERPQFTALPLGLLNDKWLQQEEPLPVHFT